MQNDNAIIITGANGNVGSYLAEKFAQSGRNLILVIHDKKNRIQKILSQYPQKIKVLSTDISNLKKLQEGMAVIINETGWQPGSLIHTATIRSHDFQPLVNSDDNLWHRIIEVNLIGTYNILKTMLPYFKQNKYGKIVLFGSNVTRIGLPKGSAYAASKAAIANIGRSLAAEEANDNIIVNTVSPGPIKIDESHFSESYRKFREEYYNEKIKEIPLKRYATFEDIFGLCKFLISKENSYITGEEFYITGGKL